MVRALTMKYAYAVPRHGASQTAQSAATAARQRRYGSPPTKVPGLALFFSATRAASFNGCRFRPRRWGPQRITLMLSRHTAINTRTVEGRLQRTSIALQKVTST